MLWRVEHNFWLIIDTKSNYHNLFYFYFLGSFIKLLDWVSWIADHPLESQKPNTNEFSLKLKTRGFSFW